MYASIHKTADVRTRIEPDLKEDAERVLAENGLTVSGAIRLFLRQVVLYKGLPFDVRTPNATTLEALAESRAMLGKQARFGSTTELLNELEEGQGRK